jgi:F-type H+-transporting ATPase subunit a
LSFAISLIEILVALLQAYIFTMLSALYFGSAVEEHHHEEAHH